MHEQATVSDEYITLTEAAKIAPGRPSTNCIWRWCRRGVKARGGERVRLQHVRIGGMIYTSARWLEAFGRALADADAKYFDLCEAAVEAARAAEHPAPRRRRPTPAIDERRQRELEQIDRELDAEGL
ncbi:MAG: DUF1580 domain-containing protein [Phycisphaerae bacterium]|nr:DUF1580 domain-containing protein [Phycisphaerae bacterium]MCZ2399194.1 DUF1580 domain-containing protein [Phycisphaerae bacterium]